METKIQPSEIDLLRSKLKLLESQFRSAISDNLKNFEQAKKIYLEIKSLRSHIQQAIQAVSFSGMKG